MTELPLIFILFAGLFCFSLTLMGLALMVLEFRRLNSSRRTKQRP